MRKELFMNGVGIIAVIDNKFYIEDETWGCYKECSKNEFIEELKKLSWVCLTTWNKDLKKDYLELVDIVKELK